MADAQVCPDRERGCMTCGNYVVITPARDEAEFLQRTIDSMVAQTVRPDLWVIVDDGSTDATPDIVARAAQQHDWIRLHRRPDRGERKVGGGVIEAFYDGLSLVNLDDYEYLCKLDGDLELPPKYFDRVLEHFAAEPALGTMSGKVYIRTFDDRLVSERIGDDMSVGALKFYRVACFNNIGGFCRVSSWDGIDCHLCRLKGWLAYSVDEPDLRVLHLRQMGSSQRGVWTGRKRWGRGKYYMGSHPLFMLAVTLYRMFERPWVIGGLGIAVGYVEAMLTRQPRFEDTEYRRFLLRYEFTCLLRGKSWAVRRLHDVIRRRGQML
jgi:glycosyltransferase involved in cell wall biosynthesis